MFSKGKVITLILIFVIVLICASCCVISKQEVFDGNRVKNQNLYDLSFSAMNKTDSHSMSFEKGSRIHVSFLIDKGDVDLYIESDSIKCYQGNNISSGNFFIDIEELGIYAIKVNAKKASGRIKIERTK